VASTTTFAERMLPADVATLSEPDRNETATCAAAGSSRARKHGLKKSTPLATHALAIAAG
jgi:hypothetical protein